jgi:hypothetical protein
MKEKHIQVSGICLSTIFFALIVWLYANEPKTFTEAATKATVTVGTYEVDKAKFNEGLQLFRQENYVAARDAFAKSDPEQRDARAQFYLAYSFYRQGWGRISNDDQLFRQGVEAASRVAALDAGFKSDDADLKLKTPAELKNELEQGLQVTADDFNPLKVLRERK